MVVVVVVGGGVGGRREGKELSPMQCKAIRTLIKHSLSLGWAGTNVHRLEWKHLMYVSAQSKRNTVRK